MTQISTGARILALCCLAAIAKGQDPFSFGPYPVGTLALVDLAPTSPPGLPPEMAGASPSFGILGFCYYPADPQTVPPTDASFNAGSAIGLAPAAGVFPLVAFQHGWAATPIDYDLFLAHLASWGFVVVAPTYIELAAGGVPDFDALDPVVQAMNTYSLLHHLEFLCQNPGFILSGHVGLGPNDRWATVGHSMGGTANFYLAAIEERIDVLVSCNPYVDQLNGLASLPPISNSCTTVPLGLSGRANNAIRLAEEYKGAMFVLSGSADPFTPPAAGRFWFDRGPLGQNRPRRSLLIEYTGVGHFSITDSTFAGLNVSFCGYPTFGLVVGAEQHRSQRTAVSVILRAELGVGPADDEDLYSVILGTAAAESTVFLVAGGSVPTISSIDSYCPEPIAYQVEDTGMGAEFGVAGLATDNTHLHLFLDDIHGFIQPFPLAGFIHSGYQRVDPPFPGSWFGEPPFPTVGLLQLEFPTVASNIQWALAARIQRGGTIVTTRLLKLP